MAVRSAELGRASFDPAGDIRQLFEVPADETWILKDLRGFIAGTGRASLYVDRAGTAYTLRVWDAAAAGGVNLDPLEGAFVCFEPGDKLNVYGDAGLTVLVAWASGAKLAGIA